MGMYQGQKIELQIEKVKNISSYITKIFIFFLNAAWEGLALFICRWGKNRGVT